MLYLQKCKIPIFLLYSPSCVHSVASMPMCCLKARVNVLYVIAA